MNQGGSTFCAVAALYLTDKLKDLTESQLDILKQWCLNRQTIGFSGRINKPWDTCNSFWIGSTLQVNFFLIKISHLQQL